MILQIILNSISAERVLVYLRAREEGYAKEIANFYTTALSPIQKQLEKFESGGVLTSRDVGRTRMYSLNKRNALFAELAALLDKAMEFYPPDLKQDLMIFRTRPRRKGKPL